MATFFSRRDGGAGSRKATGTPRVGLVYLNTEQRRLYCLNDAARQMIAEGMPVSVADLARQPLQTLSGELVRSDEMPLVRAWKDNAPQETTFLLARPNLPVLHVHWTAAPLVDERNEVIGVSGSIMLAPPEPDWQVLAGLSHDLRTPLQALRLLVPLLEETELPPEARDLADRLRSAADRSLSIGLDLLDWCRGPTQTGRRVSRDWFPLAPFLEAVAIEQQPGAQKKKIALHTDLGEAAGWEVRSDATRLGRLVSNLLSNAVRYTTAGRVEVTASWRADEPGKEAALVLRVADTGVGISAEEQESIFLPFERGKAGKEGDSGGSGLGLAVVDRLVEELGLTLEVFSEYGRGSTFEIVLPADSLRRTG
jgi:signal transduction histidine kinase